MDDRAKNIKYFLTDIDGVMTDGGMYYTNSGDEFKKFCVYDGMALLLLKEKGIKVGMITKENVKINEFRAAKLKPDYFKQGSLDKLKDVQQLCKKEGITLDEVAYVGDDINCFELLSSVGLAACPANAMPKVKSIPGIIQLGKSGGEGVLRELVQLVFGLE